MFLQYFNYIMKCYPVATAGAIAPTTSTAHPSSPDAMPLPPVVPYLPPVAPPLLEFLLLLLHSKP